MGFYTLIDGMDALPDLDDDTLEVVLTLYRSDIAEERAHITYGGESYGDTLTAIEFQLDEIEAQRRLVKDARLAQSITNAKLDDMAAITKLLNEEKQAQDDHNFAIQLAGPGNVPRQPNTNNQLPTYDEVIQPTTTPVLSKLAGLYVSEKAGKALHPANTTFDTEPEPEFEDALRTECQACGEDKLYFEVLTVPCGHEYCKPCLHEHFSLSFTDESLFPPRCCRQPINPKAEDIAFYMTRQLTEQFEEKEIEFATTDKTYCAATNCGAFIRPAYISDDKAHCQKCPTLTCVFCKKEAHNGECPNDSTLQTTLDLAREQGWQRCGRCQRMIELRTGCYHITCICGNEFCYVCGAQPWKTCGCPQWDEERLTERARHVAARARRGGQTNLAQVRQNLVERHNCTHANWRNTRGGQCEECLDHLPLFLYQCVTCALEFCRRCRDNRLR